MTDIIEQGTDAWRMQRLGKATASRIVDILAKGQGKSRANYKAELIAERLSGRPSEGFQSADMKRGAELEPEARRAYSFRTGEDVHPAGFVDHPTLAWAGASPDSFVAEDGLLELKVPRTMTHLEYIRGGDIGKDYRTQMMWQLSCTGRRWVDFTSYDPRLPENLKLFILRIERDDLLIRQTEREVAEFLAEVERETNRLRGLKL